MRVRLARRFHTLGQPEPEMAGRVRVRPRSERGKVFGKQRFGELGRLCEPDEVSLHVGDAVRAVRVPHEHAPAGGGLPPERPAEPLPAVQVRHRAARVVVREREVADAGVREQRRQRRDRARDIGLHRGHDRHAVLLAERVGEAEAAGELVDRVRLGVHAERERADLDPPLARAPEERLTCRARACRQPVLERPRHLHVPAEARVVGPGIRVLGELEHRVEVPQVVGENEVLPVGVADVEVRLMAEIDLPAPLRP